MKFLKSLIFVGVLMLAGCSAKETTPVAVLVPQGATATALLPLYGTDTKVDTVAGSDVISAELVKKDSAYDVIVAPVNLGAKLLEQGNSEYRLQSILTWGNLYIVESQEEGDFVAFGEAAVPGKILSITHPDIEATYYNSAQDVQAQLLSGKATSGLLAEPAAFATIQKAKEQGIALTIKEDLQATYNALYPSEINGYPQAAMFVKKGSEDKVKDVLKEIELFDNETAVNDPSKIVSIIDEQNLVETLGVPSSAIASKTWKTQNIKYVNASEVKDELTKFLSLFKITFQEDMLAK